MSRGRPPDQVAAAVNAAGARKMFKASVDAVAWGQPPHNLLPGNDAFDGAMARLDDLRQVFTASEAVVRGAAFPQHSVITRMPQAAG